MFDDLSRKFEDALKSLRGQDKITDINIEPALKEVRKALISADVNLSVVDEFLRDVRNEAVGIEVVRGIRPEQKLIDIVHKKLTNVMGENNSPINESLEGPTVIMLVGLQGAGKTTGAAKLGLYLKGKGKKVLMVGADTFRPAAKDQLKTLGSQIGINVYTGNENGTSNEIVEEGIRKGKDESFDSIIIDTAGRLYIDEKMMEEVAQIKKKIVPNEVLLVVDAMIGQEAAELTRVFNEKVGITGAILTKMDGDSRGGAALSIKKVSGKPIKLIGTGEKVEALEPFYPERIAGRILGMGDILSLVDKAQKEVEINDVLNIQKKFQEASFDFTDFLQQLKLISRMGSIGGLMKMIPGMNKIDDKTLKTGEIQLKKFQSMIGSMTNEEKKEPELLVKSAKRRRRIAIGSGFGENEVDKMVSDFVRMRKMMQGISKGNMSRMMDMMKNPVDAVRKTSSRTKTKQREGDSSMESKATKKKKGFFEL
jgi:signal recognition particle subunit SRP54